MATSHDVTEAAGDAGDSGMAAALIPIPDNPQAVLEASPDRATFVLIALDRARQWLISVGSIEEVNELRARAEAVRVYTRQAELGKEAENAAAEVQLRVNVWVSSLLFAEVVRIDSRNLVGLGRGNTNTVLDHQVGQSRSIEQDDSLLYRSHIRVCIRREARCRDEDPFTCSHSL
jgi:hypothetical protein